MPKFFFTILLLVSTKVFADTNNSCAAFKSAFVSAAAFDAALKSASQKILAQLGEANCSPDNYSDLIYQSCDRLIGGILYGTWECYRRDENVYYYFAINTKTLAIKISPPSR